MASRMTQRASGNSQLRLTYVLQPPRQQQTVISCFSNSAPALPRLYTTIGGERVHHAGTRNARCRNARSSFASETECSTSNETSTTAARRGQESVAESTATSQDSLRKSVLLTTRGRRTSSYGRTCIPNEPLSWWISAKSETRSNMFCAISRYLSAGFTATDTRVMKLAISFSVLGLQACAQAWAGGPEVAQINLQSSFDLGNLSDIQSGFASAFLLIFFSEIGDKTFFIAALLATRKSSIAVFSGTFGALAIMTLISVFLGRIFHYIDGILPSFGDTKLPVDDIAAVILLVYFGVSTLLDAASVEESKAEEEQQEAELAIAGVGPGGAVVGTVAATFALVFVAEWGDKSFFSTIALAAASSPLGVVTGAIVGHAAATLLAVLGGSFLGNFISEKIIAYIGGTLFLVFAGFTVIQILN